MIVKRILGKRGKITIPFIIRNKLELREQDVLLFKLDDKIISIEKLDFTQDEIEENLFNSDIYNEDIVSLEELIESLSLEESLEFEVFIRKLNHERIKKYAKK